MATLYWSPSFQLQPTFWSTMSVRVHVFAAPTHTSGSSSAGKHLKALPVGTSGPGPGPCALQYFAMVLST